jgi:hypothetical protein
MISIQPVRLSSSRTPLQAFPPLNYEFSVSSGKKKKCQVIIGWSILLRDIYKQDVGHRCGILIM